MGSLCSQSATGTNQTSQICSRGMWNMTSSTSILCWKKNQCTFLKTWNVCIYTTNAKTFELFVKQDQCLWLPIKWKLVPFFCSLSTFPALCVVLSMPHKYTNSGSTTTTLSIWDRSERAGGSVREVKHWILRGKGGKKKKERKRPQCAYDTSHAHRHPTIPLLQSPPSIRKYRDREPGQRGMFGGMGGLEVEVSMHRNRGNRRARWWSIRCTGDVISECTTAEQREGDKRDDMEEDDGSGEKRSGGEGFTRMKWSRRGNQSMIEFFCFPLSVC